MVPLVESPGNVQISIGPKLQARIELGLAFESAASSIYGTPKPVWNSPNEWVQLLAEQKLVELAAKDEDGEIEEEEKLFVTGKKHE